MSAADVNIVIGAQDKASSVLTGVVGKVGNLSGAFAALGPASLAIGAAVAGAAAGFISLGAAIAGTINAANNIDGLVDKANGLGVAIGDLQAFQFAMSEAGNVDSEQSIQALQKLQRVIGEIATGGNKSGQEVFEKLKLDAEELSMQNPIDQFMTVKDAIAGVGNISERAAVAQALLGKSASELIPALVSEKAAFEESMNAAAALGAAVSDEGAAGVAAMNDAIGRVSTGIQGVFNELAVDLAPMVKSIADYIASWIPPIIDLLQRHLPPLVAEFAKLADFALEIPRRLGRGFSGDLGGLFRATAAGDTWAGALAKAQQDAVASAAQSAMMRQSSLPSMKEGTDAAQQKADEASKKVIETLQRQLAVAQTSEESVKRQEQLAAATSDAERVQISLLQRQLSEAEKLKEVQRVQAEALKDSRAKFIKANSDIPIATATQGRLLLRGRNDPVAELVAEVKLQTKTAQRAVDKMTNVDDAAERIYQAIKAKQVPLEPRIAPNP